MPSHPYMMPNQQVHLDPSDAAAGIHERSVRSTLEKAPSWGELEDVACMAAKMDEALDRYFEREGVPFDPSLHQLREEMLGTLLKIGYCRGGVNESSLKQRGYL